MKVLVTGGAGFVGTNLIKRLLSDGHKVVSIDNYYTGKKENHQEGCKYLNHDLRNLTEFMDVDVVFHLAAIARIQPSFKLPKEYFTTNANATLNLVDWCANNNVPIIYAGSSSKHSGRFKNPYTFSKDVGEDIITLYQEHYNLKSSITRFYNVYGPHHLKEGGYCTVIGKWEKAIEDGYPLTIYGDGTKRRDFTHIEDIVDALVKIMEQEAYGYDFELGRGKNYSIKDIADMFEYGDVVYEDNKPGEALVTLCEDTLASEVLGWKPIRDIDDYIKDYIQKWVH
jgi:UDP-glucose 4-epimerase